MERAQNRLLLNALRGGLVAVLTVAVLALALPARAASPTLDSPDERTGRSVSGGQAAPSQEALHLVTTQPRTARLVPSSGSAPALTLPVPTLRLADGLDAPVVAPALTSRPPLRILFCTWLN
jgi:hypothetical protein